MENEIKEPLRTGFNRGLGFGLLLVLIGLVFLGVNFGLVSSEAKRILISWPMLLIVIGVSNLLKRHNLSGTILVIVGSFFLIPRIITVYPNYFPGLDGSFAHTFWPVLLIVAGGLMIYSRVFSPKWMMNDWTHHRHNKDYRHYRRYSKWEGNSNGFSKNSIFGSGEHIVLDPEFKGGELNAVFGGITLDLRKTNLPEGDTVLDMNAVFGGITIVVPETWLVETHLDAVFGGFEDKRFKVDVIDNSRKLIITGACVFGGGELRD